jgi:hypothetical protein
MAINISEESTRVPLGRVIEKVFKSLVDPTNALVKFVGFFIAVSGACTYIATTILRTELTPLLVAFCLLSGAVLTLFIALFRLVWQYEAMSMGAENQSSDLQNQLRVAQEYRVDLQAAEEMRYRVQILQAAVDAQDVDALFDALWQNVVAALTEGRYFQVESVRGKRFSHLTTAWRRDRSREAKRNVSYDRVQTFKQEALEAINKGGHSAYECIGIPWQSASPGASYTKILWLWRLPTTDVWYVYAFYFPGRQEAACKKEYDYVFNQLAEQLRLAFEHVAARHPTHEQASPSRLSVLLPLWDAIRTNASLRKRNSELEKAAKEVELQLRMSVIHGGPSAATTDSDLAHYRILARQAQTQSASFATRIEQETISFGIPITRDTASQRGEGIFGTIRAIQANDIQRSIKLADNSDLSGVTEYLHSNVVDLLDIRQMEVQDRGALEAYHREAAHRPISNRMRVLYHIHIFHRAKPRFWDDVQNEYPELARKVELELWAKARLLDRPIVIDDGHGHYYISGYDSLGRELTAIQRDGQNLRRQILGQLGPIGEGGSIRIGIFHCCEHTGKEMTPEEWCAAATTLSATASTNSEDKHVKVDQRIKTVVEDTAGDTVS